MKNSLCLFLLFLYFIVLNSCKDCCVNNPSPSCFEPNSNDTITHPLESKWLFLGFYNKNSKLEECKPISIREMNIRFDNSDNFSATSSCNV